MKFQTHDLIEHQNLRIEFHSGGLTYDINRPSISWIWPKLPKFRMSLFWASPKNILAFKKKHVVCSGSAQNPSKQMEQLTSASGSERQNLSKIPGATGVRRCRWRLMFLGFPGWWCEIVGMLKKRTPCKRLRHKAMANYNLHFYGLKTLRCQILISQFRLMASDSFSLFDVTQIKKKICHGNGKQQLQHPSFLL